MIVVTGGAGFIGSNLVKALNEQGERDILVVDDLTDGTKFRNIADCELADYMDKDEFRLRFASDTGFLSNVKAVFHEGACSATTEWDGKFMMDINYRYSVELLAACEKAGVPFYYASSAAVYGGSARFTETPENEKPLNVYGYSKLLFDQYVRRRLPSAKIPIVGFRYFNVYGPREMHKGGMSSVAWHFSKQLEDEGQCKLFAGCDGYENGEQRRDFIDVADVVKVNLWFRDQGTSGIFNLGTGRSQPFNDVANAVVDWYGRGDLSYVPFPDALKGRYQSFTEANMTKLREAGYGDEFSTVAQGTERYLNWLQAEGLRDRG